MLTFAMLLSPRALKNNAVALSQLWLYKRVNTNQQEELFHSMRWKSTLPPPPPPPRGPRRPRVQPMVARHIVPCFLQTNQNCYRLKKKKIPFFYFLFPEPIVYLVYNILPVLVPPKLNKKLGHAKTGMPWY